VRCGSVVQTSRGYHFEGVSSKGSVASPRVADSKARKKKKHKLQRFVVQVKAEPTCSRRGPVVIKSSRLLRLSRGEGRCDVTGTANHWRSIPDLSPALAPCEPIASQCSALLLICLGSPSNAAGATRVAPCCPSREAQTGGAVVIDKRREPQLFPHLQLQLDFHGLGKAAPSPSKTARHLSLPLTACRETASILGELLPEFSKYLPTL
jgi:hypothetical protein